MPDYPGLKAEIALPAYSGMTDEEIATALQASITVPVDVPVGAVGGYYRSKMLLTRLRRYVATPPTGAPEMLVEGLAEMLDTLDDPHSTVFSMSDPTTSAAVIAILGASVAVGLISAQNEADLLAMGARTTTRAEQLGFTPNVHDLGQEILAARKWGA